MTGRKVQNIFTFTFINKMRIVLLKFFYLFHYNNGENNWMAITNVMIMVKLQTLVDL